MHQLKRRVFFIFFSMEKLHVYYVYILTNKTHSVLYTGITNNLVRRVKEHSEKRVPGFTSKYNVNLLVYYETFDFVDLAIRREKQIKGYSRKKKMDLINKLNPSWENLLG